MTGSGELARVYYNGDGQREGLVRCGYEYMKEPWAYTVVCFVQVADPPIALTVDATTISVYFRHLQQDSDAFRAPLICEF